MSEIRESTLEEIYNDIEFAQAAKLGYEKKLASLQKLVSDVRLGIRGAQAMIDDATAEIERRSKADE